MSRAITIGVVAFLLWAIATPLNSAELISSVLCVEQDYNKYNRTCSPGKALRGPGIVIGHTFVKKVYLLTKFRTDEEEELSHVWFFKGERMPQERPTVYVEREKTFLENIAAELDLLRNQRNVNAVSAVTSIVKLVISPSVRYRTRSSKLLGPEWVGEWVVEVYDERSRDPLDRITFTVR